MAEDPPFTLNYNILRDEKTKIAAISDWLTGNDRQPMGAPFDAFDAEDVRWEWQEGGERAALTVSYAVLQHNAPEDIADALNAWKIRAALSDKGAKWRLTEARGSLRVAANE